MATITQTNRAGQYCVSEQDCDMSKDVGTLLVDPVLYEAGTILGLQTATQNYGRLDVAASDGLEVAAAILFDNQDTTLAAVDAVVHTRLMQYNREEVVLPAGITPAEITTMEGQLALAFIIARDGCPVQ